MTTALLTFIIGFALFFNSSPQQLLMVQAGEGGGELIAGAAVQIAFNFGNAIGSIVGGAALTATAMNYHFTGIAGAPISLLAVILLVLYTRRYEARASPHPNLPILLPQIPSQRQSHRPQSAKPTLRRVYASVWRKSQYQTDGWRTLSVGLAERCGETDGFPHIHRWIVEGIIAIFP